LTTFALAFGNALGVVAGEGIELQRVDEKNKEIP
jgi:hypothetical protein